MDSAATHEKIKQLRFAQENGLPIKKAALGYQCKEVEAYIESLYETIEQSNKAFADKIEEYVSQISMLAQEREQLIKSSKEDAQKIEKQNADLKTLIERRLKGFPESEILLENNSLKKTIARLENELERDQQIKKQAESLAKQNAILTRDIQQVSKENQGLKEGMEKLRVECKRNEAGIQSLLTLHTDQNTVIDRKMEDYKHRLDSNIENADVLMNELIKIIGILSTSSVEFYKEIKAECRQNDPTI